VAAPKPPRFLIDFRPDKPGRTEIAPAISGIRLIESPAVLILPRAEVDVRADQGEALAFTSAAAPGLWAHKGGETNIYAYAVGPATGEAARAEGFRVIHEGAGGAASLARHLVEARAGPIVHAAGAAAGTGFVDTLIRAGLQARRVVLYDAGRAGGLSEAARSALHSLDGDAHWGAILASSATAQACEALLEAQGLSHTRKQATAYVLSPAVAHVLDESAWHGVRIAGRPDSRALTACVHRDLHLS
jgi:uroporphyrinogen-III synthase